MDMLIFPLLLAYGINRYSHESDVAKNPAETAIVFPGYLSGKIKPPHIHSTAGTHRRSNPGT